MKKQLGILFLAAFALMPTAQADVIGFEVGAYNWTADYSGRLATDSALLAGTAIDVQQDLGYTDNSNNVIWLALEHPAPLIPNIKIVISDFDASASSTLSRDLDFAGSTFTTSEDISSTFDTSNTEYTIYYEILDNWVNIDIGFTIRQYDGEISLATSATGTNINASEKLDFTIPLLYAKARFDLPFSGFFVDAEINTISAGDNEITDTAFAVGYESDIGFGAKAGYRSFTFTVSEGSFNSNLDFDGSYISAFYHF